MSSKLNQIEYQSNHSNTNYNNNNNNNNNNSDIEVSKTFISTSSSSFSSKKSNENVWILRDDFVNNNTPKSTVNKPSPLLKQQTNQPISSCLKLNSSKNKNKKTNKSVTYAPLLSQGMSYFVLSLFSISLSFLFQSQNFKLIKFCFLK